jgi:hypothetical protein
MKPRKHAIPANRTGLVLGLALAAGGIGLLVAAPEMTVSHAAIRHVRSSIEHVSSAGSQFYGAVLLLVGLGIFIVSLPRSGK